jgi:undecaprenyl-phosphate 4-deoxy-4-formamido-L-arabinose transferase
MGDSEISHELILVCDDSPDGSWEVIKDLKMKNSEIKALNLSKNVGQHNAILAGLSIAVNPLVVTMDDDLQHDPRDIQKLIAALEPGVDVVYAEFASKHHPFWKKIGSTFNNLVASIILQKPRNLYLSPFRIIRKEIVDQVLLFRGPFAYIDGLLISSTKRIKSVLVSHNKRFSGKSLYGFSKSLKLWVQMATNTSIAPLRFTTILGIAVASLSFLIGVLLVVTKLIDSAYPVGWASLIVTVLFLSGIQLLSLGVLGEYLGKAALALSGKPQYVIKDQIN